MTISTRSFVENYGSTFKPISKLKEEFADLNDEFISVLAVSIGEYDNRGQQGYVLAGFLIGSRRNSMSSWTLKVPEVLALMLSYRPLYLASQDRVPAISLFAKGVTKP